MDFGYQDLVLFDWIRPMLYTTINNEGQMFINSMPDFGIRLIAPTTPQRVIDLLQDKITLREIFLGADIWRSVTDYDGNITVCKVTADEVDKELPTAGEYMEADPGEFDDEIEILRQRI